MKKLLGLLAVTPLAITSCGGGSTKDVKGNVITIVAEGSVSDGTFNQSVFDGSKAAKTSNERILKADSFEAKTTEEAQLKTAYIDQIANYETLLLPGFTHGTKALADVAAANKDRFFVLYDSSGYVGNDGFKPLAAENIATVTYKVEQAAWIAGYALAKQYEAAGKALKLGTFGGMSFPSVYSFMAGIEKGILAFMATTPSQAHAVVKPGAWSTVNDFFTGNFNAGGGKAKSEALIAAGANVLMPVAGPQTGDAIEVAKADAKGVKVIGVDVDAENLYAEADLKDILITSILKNLKATTQRIIGEELYAATRDLKSFNKNTSSDWASGEIGLATNTTGTGDLLQANIDAAVTEFNKLTSTEKDGLACSTTFVASCS